MPAITSVPGTTPPEQDVGNVYLAQLDAERLDRVRDLREQLLRREGVVPDDAGPGLGRRIASDLGRGLVETPRAVATGVIRAGGELFETVGQIIDPVADFLQETVPLPELEGTVLESPDALTDALVQALGGNPESVTGRTVQGVSQFASGFLGGQRLIRLVRGGAPATRVGRAVEAAAAGAIADVFTIDEIEGNLSSLVQSVPELQNPVTEFLATDPDDPVALNKFRQAAEGVVAGGALDLLVSGVRFAAKARKSLFQTTESAAEKGARKAIAAGMKNAETPNAEILGNPKGPLFRIDDATVRKADEFLAGKVETAGETRIGNVNLNRVASDTDIEEVIRKSAKLFEGKVTTTRQTNEQTAALAREIGADPERMRAILVEKEALTAPEITALRFHLNSSAERLQELASLAAGGDGAAQFEFLRQFNFHKGLLERTSGAAREAGRALQAMKIQGETLDEMALQIQDALDSGINVRDLAEKVARLQTREQLAAFARTPESVIRRGGDALLEYWVNSLLAGPKTHVVNFTSNAIVNLGMSPAERLTSVAVAKALGREGVYWSEAAKMAFAVPRGMRDGLSVAYKAILDENIIDQFAKSDLPARRAISASKAGLQEGTPLALGVDFLGKAVRTPGRLLNAADQFWKAVGYRMQLHADSWQRALSEGLEGEDLARRYADLLDNPPPDLHMAAVDMARYNTFTNPLGKAGQSFQSFVNLFPPARLIFPFLRTPTNILKFTIHRSPFALASPRFWTDVAAGGNRQTMAIARLGLGSATMAAFADLAAQGHISGSGPADARLQSALRRTGWQPYSFKLGDQWVAYQRLDPLGLSIGVAADLSQIVGQLEDNEVDSVMGPVLTAVSDNFIDKSYMTGMAAAMELFTAPSEAFSARRGERYVQRLAGSFVPNLFGQVARGVDPTLRQAEGIVQEVMRRTPGYSQELPPRLNLWGEPIVLAGGVSERIMSPVWRSPIAKDAVVDREIVENEIAVSMPARKVSFPGMGSETIELTQEQYNRYVELAGNGLKDPRSGLGAKDMLERIVTGRGIENPTLGRIAERYRLSTGGPEGGKAAIIKQVISDYRTAAKAVIFDEFPAIREQAARTQRRRLELLGN